MENFYEINFEKNMNMLSQAVKYCETDFLHEDLINELYLNNDLKKQLCIILLSKLSSQNEADALVHNLTKQPGPIRETVAFKILELIKNPEFQIYFQTRGISDTFAEAITDINPSVSRYMIECIKYLNNPQHLFNNIINKIKITLNELPETKKIKSYDLNKKNFNLYWNLEAVIALSDKISPNDELLDILKITALSNDYTIREKTAKAAKYFSVQNPKFTIVKDLLKNDNNIYVKKYID